MATRALIVVHDDFDGREMVTIYKHWDGYPEAPGLGATLAEFLANIRLVNGLPVGDKSGLANGMDCLAAQIVAFLKEEAGDVYLQATGTRDMGEEYIYHVLPPAEGDPEARPRLFVWNVWEKELFRLHHDPAAEEGIAKEKVALDQAPEALQRMYVPA